jgi:alpha-N-arabinofuranosidase
MTATLNVDITHPKAAVSPMLYGLMTEEINYSYDGGLYAEMVRNRTFRSDWSGILNWFLVEKGSASAKVSIDQNDGPSAALKASAKLEVIKADANSGAGVLNEGYWGFAVRPNTRYSGSMFAKSDAQGALSVRVALVANQTGQVLAQTSVAVAGGWKEYEFEMRSGSASASAENHLEVTVDKPATLWLQLVSLFPPTYHDRPNGNRLDIMEKMAAMRPQVPAVPRRQLSGRQPDRDAIRLEENDRAASGSSDASGHLELPFHRRNGLAGVPGMVRGPAHGAGSRDLCGIFARRTGGEAWTGS